MMKLPEPSIQISLEFGITVVVQLGPARLLVLGLILTRMVGESERTSDER